MSFILTAHMSDLERNVLADSLAALAGDIGIDCLCIRAVSNERSVVYTNESGDVQHAEFEDGACFQPDSKLYAGTRLRPHTQSWIKHRNPLDALTRAAKKNRLALRLRLSCCYQPTVAQRNKMLTCVNILGATDQSWLCPSHPEVREYLCALAEDVNKNYAPETIELEHAGFANQSPAHPGVLAALESGADLTCAAEMLTWCFCASCRERMSAAGLDPADVTKHGLALLGRVLNLDQDSASNTADWLMNDPRPQILRDVAAQTVRSLLNSIAQRANTAVQIVHPPSTANIDIPGAAFLESLIAYNDDQIPSRVPCPVYRAYPPICPDGPTLVAAVHAAATSGYDQVGFADFGLLAPASLDWVRQAIRFAKRVAS